MRIAAAVALLALLAGGAGVLIAGDRLAAPARRAAGLPPAFLPGVRAVAVPHADGRATSAWWSAPPGAAAAVVLAHAVRGHRGGMLGRARFLTGAGYAVLLYDAQAHGETEGEAITFGAREADDAAASVAFARATLPGAPVGFIGSSLGGAAALLGPRPLAADALVLEAVYSRIEDAIANRLALRLGPAGRLLAPLLWLQLGPRLGLERGALRPIERIGAVRAPIFLLVGELDRHTTLEETRRMLAAAPEPKELWVVPDAAHVDLHRFAPEAYERRVLAFLAEHLRAAPP